MFKLYSFWMPYGDADSERFTNLVDAVDAFTALTESGSKQLISCYLSSSDPEKDAIVKDYDYNSGLKAHSLRPID